MIFQSIFVYFVLMLVMILFASRASRLAPTYENQDGLLVSKRSFWKLEIIIPIIIFSLVSGMRYNVGADHLTYLDNYLNGRYSGKGEVLFNVFSDIGWYFNLHYTVFFGLIAFAQILFFFLAFRHERFLFPLLIFFLFTTGNYLFLMNVMRQALAMCVWLYALKYIERKKLYSYALFCFLAFFIHRSSIILIVFYPLLKGGRDYFKSVKLQVLLLIGAFLVQQLFFNILMRFETVVTFYTSLLGDGLYDNYGLETLRESFVESEGSGIATAVKILFNFVIILYSPQLKKYYNSKRFILIYFFFFLGLLTTYIFPSGAISLSRPFRYFYIFQPIMYSYFLYFLYKNRVKSEHFFGFIAVLLLFSMIFILSQLSATENSYSLFQFYFQIPIHNGYPTAF